MKPLYYLSKKAVSRYMKYFNIRNMTECAAHLGFTLGHLSLLLSKKRGLNERHRARIQDITGQTQDELFIRSTVKPGQKVKNNGKNA